jgi:epoxyqueuosine reductase
LLSLGEEEFQRRFRGSPILRAKRRGLVRNVAVALGNLKKEAAVPALVKALQDHDPLVRQHVAWALGEIGGSQALEGLKVGLGTEMNSLVIEEIKWALSSIEERRPLKGFDGAVSKSAGQQSDMET